jgi:hypothetical protein
MSPHMQNRNAPSKPCTASNCGGTMRLQRPEDAVGGQAQGGTWVCDSDPDHNEPARSGD